MINMFKVNKKRHRDFINRPRPAKKYMVRVNYRNIKKGVEYVHKLTITTPKRRERRVFTDNFINISQL